MKKSLLQTIFALVLFSLPLCAAKLDVDLATYNSTSHLATIEIVNTNSETYSGIMLAIDSMPYAKVVKQLSPNNSVLVPVIVSHGQHKIALKTKEGIVVEKVLEFSKTYEQTVAEAENAETLWNQRQEELKEKSESAQTMLDSLIQGEIKNKEEVEKTRAKIEGTEVSPEVKPATTYDLLIGLGLLAVAAIAVLVIFRFKRKGFKPEQPAVKSSQKKPSGGAIP
ncbi:hypothetical protein FJZ53_03715 [Candidatus Woesearchaeota archaeon]|nr:hypothetical protein [Candidatus Woesearchaeota archaeon]